MSSPRTLSSSGPPSARVHVGGGLDVAEGESLDVGEEDGAVAQIEDLPASAQPCVRVADLHSDKEKPIENGLSCWWAR